MGDGTKRELKAKVGVILSPYFNLFIYNTFIA
jgi:hypothetical protein